MIEERRIKSHLIITNIHNEYSIKWCGRIIDTNPMLKNSLPIFIIIGKNSRIELNTADIKRLEDCAKSITAPSGRAAVNIDIARIYIKEVDGKETCIGIVENKQIKTYAPMFDAVGWAR